MDQHYRQVARITGQDGWTITMHEMVIKRRRRLGHGQPQRAAQPLQAWAASTTVCSSTPESRRSTSRPAEAVYTWDALDHISVRPVEGDTARATATRGMPTTSMPSSWSPTTDMLISMRDTSAIYLVSIKTGDVIWTLGGKASDFKVPSNAHFEWQHDAKLIDGGKELSMFDDHCCDITGSGTYLAPNGPSRGLVLKLDTVGPHGQPGQRSTRSATSDPLRVHGQHSSSCRTGTRSSGGARCPYITEFDQAGQAGLPSPTIRLRTSPTARTCRSGSANR